MSKQLKLNIIEPTPVKKEPTAKEILKMIDDKVLAYERKNPLSMGGLERSRLDRMYGVQYHRTYIDLRLVPYIHVPIRPYIEGRIVTNPSGIIAEVKEEKKRKRR